MRSASGGWVSNAGSSQRALLALLASRSSGDSIQSWAVARVRVVDDRRVGLQLLQRRAEPRRVTRQLHPGRVGQQLALAAHRELHELGREGSEDAAGPSPTIARIAPAAPALLRSLRSDRPPKIQNRSPMSASSAIVPTAITAIVDGEDVVVLHVRQLVGDDTLELDPVHHLRATPW